MDTRRIELMTDPIMTAGDTTTAKKAYETPELVEHGTVEQLTQVASGGSGAVAT